MTLRQINGHSSSTPVPVMACSSSTIGASSPSSIGNGANNELAQKVTSKKHLLLDQKRRQWAEEKAEHEEWYPFGRPGGGAPVKSPTARMTEQRLRNSLQSNTCRYSDGASNGSVADFTGLASNLPCRGNDGNHCTNGDPQHPYLIDPSSFPTGYVAGGPNGYYFPYPPGVMVPYFHPTAGQTQAFSPIGATIPNVLVNGPTAGPFPPMQQYPSMTLPGATDVSTSSDQTDCKKPMLPFCQQQVYGYIQETMADGQNHHYPCRTLPAFAPPPAPIFPMDSSIASNGKHSLTASTASPSCCSHMVMVPVYPRPDIPSNQNPSTGASYTEHWANQLQLWQDVDPCTPSRDKTDAALTKPIQDEHAVTDTKSAQQITFQSPLELPLLNVNTSTPVNAPHSSSTGIAWVPPLQFTPNSPDKQWSRDQPRRLRIDQRLAVVSPMNSKAPSLSGNETLDGSINNMKIMGSSVSGGLMPAAVDSRSHQRRSHNSSSTMDRDSEEKHIKMLEQKLALDEQLEEKRRKQLIEEQRERAELERAERERRRIEQREAMENEQERSRWKKLAEQEERREALIKHSVQQAQEEARRVRHAKLLRHASSGRHSESDGYESMSPPAPARSSHSNYDEQSMAIIVKDDDKDNASIVSPTSTANAPSHVSRAHSLPPPSIARSISIESPGDERPIRPLTKDPLKVWEEMGYATMEEDVSKFERRTPIRQSMRQSRSRTAAKLDAVPRSSSVERKRAAPRVIVEQVGTNGTSVENGYEKAAPKPVDVKRGATVTIKDEMGHQPDNPINSANMITDSKSNNKNTKRQEPRSLDPEGKGTILLKDGGNSNAGIVSTNGFKVNAPMDSGGKQKLLERRQSAERPVLPPATNDNPWGDTLGGLNPLLQPIVTRRRKARAPAPPMVSDEAKAIQGNPRQSKPILDPDTTSMPLSRPCIKASSLEKTAEAHAQNGHSDSNNNANKKSAATATDAPVLVHAPPDQKTTKAAFVRAPTLDRFNARSPLYGSISTKMKRPTEAQNKLLEQLSLLRQQLKKTQKEVECGLKSPSGKPVPSREVQNP